MARQNVPGTVWKSHGAWHWKVKFPDERRRRDDVREDIAAAVRQIRKSEARAGRAEKNGLEPDPSLLSEIARGKAELLGKIRAGK